MTTKVQDAVTGFQEAPDNFAHDSTKKSEPVTIKKYANRRLYNTETSTYVTLEDLSEMVRSERDFVVYDAKTGEDLTHSVLTQIIVEEEGKQGQSLLPIGFLRQLIRFYGHSMEKLVPSFLEFSINTLSKDQEKYRKHFADLFGGAALEAMHEQTMNNLAMFEKAMSMFSPFPGLDMRKKIEAADAGKVKASNAAADSKSDDIAELKRQLATMQEQLNQLTKIQEKS